MICIILPLLSSLLVLNVLFRVWQENTELAARFEFQEQLSWCYFCHLYTGIDSWLIDVSVNSSCRLYSHFQHTWVTPSSRSGLCALLPHWAMMDRKEVPLFESILFKEICESLGKELGSVVRDNVFTHMDEEG